MTVLQEVAAREPAYQLWRDYRRGVTRAGDRAGQYHLLYPAIQSPTFDGQLIVLPPAQATGEVIKPGDTVYCSFEGDAEILVGGRIHAVGPLDLIAIPAGVAHTCVNVGLGNVVLFGLFAQPVQGAAPTEVNHMAWKEYRRDFHWTLPWAENWGYHRGSGPYLSPPGLRGHTVRVPVAQTTPWHYAPRDLMFVGMEGDVEFEAAGQLWPLGRFDMLLVPAMTPYRYHNVGLEEVMQLSFGGRLEPGKKGVYFDEDPGWPIRPDAKRMRVEIDPYGDAKVVA